MRERVRAALTPLLLYRLSGAAVSKSDYESVGSNSNPDEATQRSAHPVQLLILPNRLVDKWVLREDWRR